MKLGEDLKLLPLALCGTVWHWVALCGTIQPLQVWFLMTASLGIEGFAGNGRAASFTKEELCTEGENHSPIPPLSSQVWELLENEGIFSLRSCMGHGPTDGQLGLTCSKALWQTQVGFIQDKPRIGVHLWVLLNIFLFLTWADVNLKCKCSLEVGSGSVLSLKCPYKISLFLKYTLFFFFFF